MVLEVMKTEKMKNQSYFDSMKLLKEVKLPDINKYEFKEKEKPSPMKRWLPQSHIVYRQGWIQGFLTGLIGRK